MHALIYTTSCRMQDPSELVNVANAYEDAHQCGLGRADGLVGFEAFEVWIDA